MAPLLPQWTYGIILCLFGSTLTSLGFVLQKYSWVLTRRKGYVDASGEVTLASFKQPWWIVGFAFWISAQVINFVAMGFAPQSVLSCMGSWSLTCNVAFAKLLLGEEVRKLRGIAMMGIIVSMVLVISNAPRPIHGGDSLDYCHNVLILSRRFLSVEFLAVTGILITVPVFLRSVAMRRAAAKAQSPTQALESPFTGGEPPADTAVPVSWAVCAAAASGYTSLFFKCVSQILVAGTLQKPTAWSFWQTYVILACAVIIAPSEIRMLNGALASGDAIFVVPIYFALGMVAQIMTGAAFFEEFNDFYSVQQAALFLFGVTCVLVSVAIVSKTHTPDESDNDVPTELLKADIFIPTTPKGQRNSHRSFHGR